MKREERKQKGENICKKKRRRKKERKDKYRRNSCNWRGFKGEGGGGERVLADVITFLLYQYIH